MQNSRLFKIYSLANLFFFWVQMTTLLLLTSAIAGANSILNGGSTLTQSPLFVSEFFWKTGWWLCIGMQGLFVVRGLFCAPQRSVHYQNCILLKIKFGFMMLCSLLTLSFIALSYLNGYLARPTLQALVILTSSLAIKCKSRTFLIPW